MSGHVNFIIVWLLGMEMVATVAGATPKERMGFQWNSMGEVAIQDGGRIKPLSTFAEESLLLLSSKRSWKKMTAMQVLCGWMFAYEREWLDEPFVKLEFDDLKTTLGLDKAQRYFSPRELAGKMDSFSKLDGEVGQKESRNERLTVMERNVVRLRNQIAHLNAIVRGQAVTILPNPDGMNKEWFPISRLSDAGSLPYGPRKDGLVLGLLRRLSEAYADGDAANWNEASSAFQSLIRDDLSRGKYPHVAQIRQEIFYNSVRPFSLANYFYIGMFIMLMINLALMNRWTLRLGMGLMGMGFAIHTMGFIARVVISGRAPVTNMYESIVWVSWGCVLVSFLVWLFYRNVVILIASSVFAIVALILADNAPMVLDESIQPLEPVLRSNFWLTTHVLSITLSYAAFAISLCLGNVVLAAFIFRRKALEFISELSLYMYRAVQIGVLLLAVGTILGGVWADYAWGRFWGWDPKEVWALITLLLYLAILHGRFTKWLGQFGFVAGTVLCFLGVLMAWYGVNFILGAGLHAYGFGAGGTAWIASYVVLQVAFILVAYGHHHAARWIGY